jgi:hypothetical protein
MVAESQSYGESKKKAKMRHGGRHSVANSQTSPASLDHADKIALALKYRRQGLSYPKIGNILGCDQSYAYRLVQEGIASVVREPAAELVAMELEYLNDMLEGVSQKAVEGDTRAIAAALKILEHRMKLLGAEAAERAANSSTELTPEQRRAKLSEVFQRLADAQKAAESYGGN